MGDHPPPTLGSSASLPAGHPWHQPLCHRGQKAPNTAAGCPNICLLSPRHARSPGLSSSQNSELFLAELGVLLAAGPGRKQYPGPGARAAHCIAALGPQTSEVTPRTRTVGHLAASCLGQGSCLTDPSHWLWPLSNDPWIFRKLEMPQRSAGKVLQATFLGTLMAAMSFSAPNCPVGRRH